MKFKIAYCTDIGRSKKVNQDSIGYREIGIGDYSYILMMVCDGMGGLQKGEMASTTVVRNFLDWFVLQFPIFCDDFNYAKIQTETEKEIVKLNLALHDFGEERGIQLGTTLSMIIMRNDGLYFIASVGDSRMYGIYSDSVVQITEDQTYIAQEIKNNRMTKEEAATSKYKNVLTQCIGVSGDVQPLFYRGKANAGEMFLSCSDGFRHFLSEEDIFKAFSPVRNGSEEDWTARLRQITDFDMEQGENDNITAVVVKLE